MPWVAALDGGTCCGIVIIIVLRIRLQLRCRHYGGGIQAAVDNFHRQLVGRNNSTLGIKYIRVGCDSSWRLSDSPLEKYTQFRNYMVVCNCSFRFT